MEKIEKNKFELRNISLSRGVLFGIATIWIVFFHSGLLNFETFIVSQKIIEVINLIRNMGNCGVDIFLALSGLGLYFSFSKNSEILHFYKKRLIRILPSVIIIVVIYYGIMGNITLKQYLNRIFLLSFFTDKDYNFWYFSLIIVLYLIYPFIHIAIKKFDIKALLFFTIGILIFNGLLRRYNNQAYEMYEIALTRLPVFFIGVFLGKKVYEEKKISKKWIYLFLTIFIAIPILFYFNLFEKHFFIKRYLYCPYSLSIIFLVADLKQKKNIIYRFLIWIGTYSMEIYLIYENLARIVNEKMNIIHFEDKSYISFYIFILILTIAFAINLKNICNEIKDKVLIKNNS